MKKHRFPKPISVMVISYLLLFVAAVGVVAFINVLLTDSESRKDSAFITYAIVSAVLHATCGIFMLRGANWARIAFFAVVFPIVLGLGLRARGPADLPWHLVFILLCLRLLSKPANRFFLGRSTLLERKRVPERPELKPALKREEGPAERERRSHRARKYDF